MFHICDIYKYFCTYKKVYVHLYMYLYEFRRNLNMIRPKNQTEDLLLSITKNCETLIRQTHTKPQETLEFKMTKPRETFHFNTRIQVKED